jgi:hypothetical protein
MATPSSDGFGTGVVVKPTPCSSDNDAAADDRVAGNCAVCASVGARKRKGKPQPFSTKLHCLLYSKIMVLVVAVVVSSCCGCGAVAVVTAAVVLTATLVIVFAACHCNC